MVNKNKRGRYDSAEYVKEIIRVFQEKFPDSVPPEWVVDHTIKYFWKLVEEKLKHDEVVNVFAFGKFHLKKGTNNRTHALQYYPKFKFSRHFLLRLREHKGTLTESEKKEVAAKKEFVQKVWDKRKAYMLRTRGVLPKNLRDMPLSEE